MNGLIEQQNAWPELKFELLQDTIQTVQLWTQIVGKIRLRQTPRLNHSWNVTLYVSPRGLTTGSMQYDKGIFELEFDFITHRLLLTTSEGHNDNIALQPGTIAGFYKELFDKLKAAGIYCTICAIPNEIDPAIPFRKDMAERGYNKEQMHQYWKALIAVDKVFNLFRAGFTGKCSPVHLFWGAFDLAVTRFSGRKAPLYQGQVPNMPLDVMQEAYSHEVCSAGFWPGSKEFPHPAFYAYCYPNPDAFGQQAVQPSAAFYNKEMGEFFLVYDEVRLSAEPEQMLIDFLQYTYEAAAITGGWDMDALEFKI